MNFGIRSISGGKLCRSNNLDHQTLLLGAMRDEGPAQQ